MITMSHVVKIREMYQEGNSISTICAETGHDYKTIKKYLEKEDFSEKIPSGSNKPTKLTPYKEEIAQLLDTNTGSWHKHRLTAKRVHTLMKKKHQEFDASYNTVQRFVKDYRIKERDGVGNGYSRLYWHPGEAQADFGEADFIIDNQGTKKRYKYFVLAFPYSNKAFTQIFSGENCECVCQALVNIFNHIKGVPTRIVFDNATGIGKRVCHILQENEMFLRFKTHYHFKSTFANPYSGNEKGNVETQVGYIRRNLFTPEIHIPSDIEKFNKEKLFTLLNDEVMVERNHYIKNLPVNELFKDDKAVLSDLPGKSFQARRVFFLKTNGYGEITLAGKHLYGLPNNYRNLDVTVVTTAWTVEIYNLEGKFIEKFERAYGSERTETVNITTEINNVVRKTHSWINSQLCKDLQEEETFIHYIDQIEDSKKISSLFKDFKKNMLVYGFESTLEAAKFLIEKKQQITHSDLCSYCDRLASDIPFGSINDTQVDLKKYDIAFGLISNKSKLSSQKEMEVNSYEIKD